MALVTAYRVLSVGFSMLAIAFLTAYRKAIILYNEKNTILENFFDYFQKAFRDKNSSNGLFRNNSKYSKNKESKSNTVIIINEPDSDDLSESSSSSYSSINSESSANPFYNCRSRAGSYSVINSVSYNDKKKSFEDLSSCRDEVNMLEEITVNKNKECLNDINNSYNNKKNNYKSFYKLSNISNISLHGSTLTDSSVSTLSSYDSFQEQPYKGFDSEMETEKFIFAKPSSSPNKGSIFKFQIQSYKDGAMIPICNVKGTGKKLVEIESIGEVHNWKVNLKMVMKEGILSVARRKSTPNLKKVGLISSKSSISSLTAKRTLYHYNEKVNNKQNEDRWKICMTNNYRKFLVIDNLTGHNIGEWSPRMIGKSNIIQSWLFYNQFGKLIARVSKRKLEILNFNKNHSLDSILGIDYNYLRIATISSAVLILWLSIWTSPIDLGQEFMTLYKDNDKEKENKSDLKRLIRKNSKIFNVVSEITFIPIKESEGVNNKIIKSNMSSNSEIYNPVNRTSLEQERIMKKKKIMIDFKQKLLDKLKLVNRGVNDN